VQTENNTDVNLKAIRCELDSLGSPQGPVSGYFKHGIEPSGSINGEFLDQFNNCQLLKAKSMQ
jgi:hypothetical protein